MIRIGSPLYCIALTAALALSQTARSQVEFVQITAQNAAQHLDAQTQSTVREGDVVLRNELIQVAILTTATPEDPARAARCLLLRGPASASQWTSMAIEPVQGLGWESPEAGMNGDVAVVRFHRDSQNARAELIYRLRAASPALEISTRIINNDRERVLEVPVVDGLSIGEGVEASESNGGAIIADFRNLGIASAYMAQGSNAKAQEMRRGWQLGAISGDPQAGIFRRVSQRLNPFSRGDRSFSPIEPNGDWHRQFRDKETWFRIQPGKQRAIDRRLVVASSKDDLARLVEVVRNGSAIQFESAGPTITIAPKAAANTAKTTGSSTTQPRATSNKIVGKLRSDAAPPEPLPSAVLQPSIAPVLPEPEPNPPAQEAPTIDFAPTIDAIEDLPPPTE